MFYFLPIVTKFAIFFQFILLWTYSPSYTDLLGSKKCLCLYAHTTVKYEWSSNRLIIEISLKRYSIGLQSLKGDDDQRHYVSPPHINFQLKINACLTSEKCIHSWKCELWLIVVSRTTFLFHYFQVPAFKEWKKCGLLIQTDQILKDYLLIGLIKILQKKSHLLNIFHISWIFNITDKARHKATVGIL